jgi:RND family efflux transporter MFP subunit
MRLALQILLPLVLLAAGILGMRTLAGMRTEPEHRDPEVTVPLVRAVTVAREEVPIVVAARGEVAPRAETRLLAEVFGRVTWVAPALVPGGFFRAGDPLIESDDTDYVLALKDAELAVAQAELRRTQEAADAEVARREWERLGRDETPSPLTLREPQLAEAAAAVAAAEARVARAERDVARCRVAAPYDGRVRTEHVDVGQTLVVGAEIATVYATDAAEVRLLIDDADLEFLDLPLGAAFGDDAGPRVTLRAEFAGAGHAWEARITRTEAALDPRTRMVVAVVTVLHPYGSPGNGDSRGGRPPLAAGMFVDAEIAGEPVNAVPLPRAALRGDDTVAVVADGAIELRRVDVLHSTRDRVLVGRGIEPGDRVVVSPLANAVGGMRVEVVEGDPEDGR